MKKKVALLEYKEVLNLLKGKENHLLLGNGFNRGIGVDTSYFAIFNKMIVDNRGIYKDAQTIVTESNYDIEKFIGKLENDIDPYNTFLKKYIRNKVKYDFMKAAHQIVKAELKNIYAEKNEGVYILLQNFNTFFTLNYDSFLYVLLLNFKNNQIKDNAIGLQLELNIVENIEDERHNNIYKEIKFARENGSFKLSTGEVNDTIEKSLNKLTKVEFVTLIKNYASDKNKNWLIKDIERVAKELLEDEKREYVLKKVDDGSRQTSLTDKKEFIFQKGIDTQNLFFLHGAFHIYNEKGIEKKITQKTDKALYDRLEEVLNNEDQEIVTIFQSEDKLDEIEKNNYLMNCFNKLSSLSGTIVIIGCSLDDNDNHIFEQINKSEIHTLYISLLSKNKERFHKICGNKFPNKNVILFDAETITYEKPFEN